MKKKHDEILVESTDCELDKFDLENELDSKEEEDFDNKSSSRGIKKNKKATKKKE